MASRIITKKDGVWVLLDNGSKVLLSQKPKETFLSFEARAAKHKKEEKK